MLFPGHQRWGEQETEAGRFKVIHKCYMCPAPWSGPPLLSANLASLISCTPHHQREPLVSHLRAPACYTVSISACAFIFLECPLRSCSSGKLLDIHQKPHHRLSPPDMGQIRTHLIHPQMVPEVWERGRVRSPTSTHQAARPQSEWSHGPYNRSLG